MAAITNHDTAFGSRVATEPLSRTAQRVAGKGPLGVLTSNLPLFEVGGGTVGTYHPAPTLFGKEDRRSAHGG